MAFPLVRGTATTAGTTATTTPAVNLPATIRAGDTLVVEIRVAVAGAIGWPADWTELFESTADASDDVTAAAWRKADGTEGATITLSSGNGKFAAIAYAIQDAADPLIRPPEFAALVTGTSTTPDPGLCTPTGGAKDYLWLWFGAWEGEQTSPPASTPTNYTDALGASSGTAGVATTNVRVASARRALNAASEDAPSWTISASDDWTATTIVVHPAEAVPAPLQTESDRPNPLPIQSLSGLASFVLGSSMALLVPTVEVAPFAQSEWPLPAGRGHLLTTVESRPQEDGVQAFRQTDWPIPQGPPLFLAGRTWTLGLQQSTLAPVAGGAPFAPIDWPVPVGRPSAVGLTTWTQSPAVPEAAAGPKPEGQAEQAPPQPRPTLQTLTTWTHARPSYYEEPAVESLPPGRAELPAPAPRPLLATLTTWTHAKPTYYVDAVPGVPFAQVDWPLPLRARQAPITSRSFAFWYVVDDTPPFAQTVWPIPAPRTAALPTLQTWLQTRPVFAQDTKPFHQTDWPAGRATPPIVGLTTWADHAQQGPLSLPINPIPPGQAEQAPPKPRPTLATLTTWTQERKGYYVDGRIHRQSEWPVPAPRPQASALLTWTQPAITVAPPAPFSQRDWPILRRPVTAVDLQTWTQARKSYYQDLQPFDQADWPTPLPIPRHPSFLVWTGGERAPLPVSVAVPQAPTTIRAIRRRTVADPAERTLLVITRRTVGED